MTGITIRRANGDCIELDAGQTLDAAELRELLGDADNERLLQQLVELVTALKNQKAPASAEPAKDWKRADMRVTERDGHGAIKSVSFEKVY